MMRYFLDTEFDGLKLISIGLVCEDGREYYAELPTEVITPWLLENVCPHLTGETKPAEQVAEELRQFVIGEPEFWAWYGAYDWVLLCELFGGLMDLPQGWPKTYRELLHLGRRSLPENSGVLHNALDDARWNKRLFESPPI